YGHSDYLSSLEGYGSLHEFWAGYGFMIIQTTHLRSKSLGIGLGLDSLNCGDMFLDSRAQDLDAVPLLKGRLDRIRISDAGHSLGAMTASVLLGMKNTDPRDGTTTQIVDKRIRIRVLVGATGGGGSDLSEAEKKLVALYGPDFCEMRTPALIGWGEDTSSHLTIRDAGRRRDPHTFSPGPKDSLMVKGGKHVFGGISGWDAGETLDESPDRLAVVQRMTLAYLRSQLCDGDKFWLEACGWTK
ncbi:hypothetical protein K493DRAFT_212725, partial [Basidiobolus meristosporus CBS 931.73]